jgi:hypothetical protein
MGLLEDARKKNSSGSLLRKYRSKFDISDDSINETLSSIKTTMENDRLKTVYESQGVGDVQNQIAEKEKPAEGFLGVGLFSGAQRDYRDIFKREEKDSEYRSQIEKNVKTISELLKKKKENPDKANDYNVMVQALQDKNKMLVEATGGDIKDLSTGQLALRSFETATDVMPFGAGITQAGRAVLKSGTKAVIGSLAKEGAATGIIGGSATAGQRENTTPMQFLGDVATSAIVSAAATVGLGIGMNKLGDKVGNWLRGDKVDFTPKEKDALADVPELQDEALFEQAGIESPIKKTDDDLMSETVSSTNNPETIAEILKTKIPDEQTRAKVAKQLEVIEDPDEVKRIIDSYDPVKIREDLALKIATTDNEKRIASFLKGVVSDDDIPTLSRTMKGMEDETQITKLLDEFQIKEEPAVEVPNVDIAPVEPTKMIERDMTEQEIATALAKKELSRYKETDSRFQANRKAVGMAYSSLKKRLEGNATAKEVKNTRKYLESNYVGKEVKVDGRKGVVKKNAFGRPGVDFGDGKIEYFDAEKVKSKKVSDKEVYAKIIDDARKELDGKKKLYSISTKVSEPEKVAPVEKVTESKTAEKKNGSEDPLLQEAKKYSTPEEFVNSFNLMKSGEVTSIGQLPIGKVNKTQIKSITERGLPHTDTNLKVKDFTPGRKVTQPLEVYSKGNSYVVENGNHRLAQALANGDTHIPAVFKRGEGKSYTTHTKSQLTDLWKQAQGGSKETPKSEPTNAEPKSEKPNKSGLVKTLEKTAEKRGVKLKKEEIPRLASKMKMDDETKMAFKFYAEDPQKAIEMAIKGEAPEGVRVGSLYTAVRDTAIIQNDIDTLYRLRSAGEAKGAIEAAAEAGRDVKAYDSTIMSDPVKIMREIDDLKKQIAEKSGVDIKKDVKIAEEEIATFIEKNASTDSDLSKLVQKITC